MDGGSSTHRWFRSLTHRRLLAERAWSPAVWCTWTCGQAQCLLVGNGGIPYGGAAAPYSCFAANGCSCGPGGSSAHSFARRARNLQLNCRAQVILVYPCTILAPIATAGTCMGMPLAPGAVVARAGPVGGSAVGVWIGRPLVHSSVYSWVGRTLLFSSMSLFVQFGPVNQSPC